MTETAPLLHDTALAITAMSELGPLFDTFDLGVALYTSIDDGRDFRIVDINPSGARLGHVVREEVIGRRLTEIFPGAVDFGLLAALERVWRSGNSEVLPPTEYREGQIAGWFENHVARLSTGHIAAVYSDVTDRITGEQALQASEERYRLLAESILDGIYDWDIANNRLFLSPRWKAQLGYRDDELPDQLLTWTNCLHPDDRARVLTHLDAFLLTPSGSWEEDFRLRHRDGHYRHFMARGAAVTDTDGKVVRLLGVHIDIDQRKRAENRLGERIKELQCLYSVHQVIQQRLPIDQTCEHIVRALNAATQHPGRVRAGLTLDGNDHAYGPGDVATPHRLSSPLLVGSIKHGEVSIVAPGDVSFLLPEEQHLLDGIAKALGTMLEREEAAANQQMLERVISTTTDLMSFVDRDYCYRFVNDAYAINWNLDKRQIIGRTVGQLMGEETFENLVRPRLDRCLCGEIVSYQALFRYADGERYMDVLYRPYRDGNNAVCGAVVSARDITALHQAQEKIRQAGKAFNSTAEGITITGLDGTILDVNDAFCGITGYSREEAVGRNPRILQSGRHSPAYYEAMWRTLKQEGSWRGEIWNRRKSGETYPSMLTISVVRDERQQPSGYVAVFSDITTVKQTEERLEHLAHHDPLTQLPNRLLFSARLRQSLNHSARSKTRLAVMFIDIDSFKHVNDSLGHPAGDSLLIQIAERLTSAVRTGDTLARISGDEFIVLLEDIGNAEHVATVAQKIMDRFTRPFKLAGKLLRVTCSIGISLFPADGDEATILMRNADTAMYRAKENGRNNYQFYSREMTSAAFEKIFIENALRNAIEQNEFRLVYQPQVNLDDGRMSGVEALVRWHHPEQGVIAPTRFIPIAEQSGLIQQIGAWVLNEACRQARRWQDMGLAVGRVAINISGKQIQQACFAGLVESTLQEHDLEPDRIELEVTESFLMEKVDAGLSQLMALHDMGIALAIDDFGTGYSSLTYLKRLPIGKLKIDRSFVSDIPHDSDDMAISEAVIALARAMDLQVIAEGIETEAQAQFLRDRGCFLGQGYLYSRPLPPEALELFALDRMSAP